ncbi:MAG: ABC transporter permease [Firmicutes bacterium]|jgi:ABC-2 type transport system permease protein|nr:ABC transporter permease [Bacillota bacterium]
MTANDIRTAAAVLRKDLIVFRRYPTWIVSLLIWPALFPAMYVFMARTLSGPGGQAVAAFQSVSGTDDYIGFLLFGIIPWMILNTTLWDFGTHLRTEQVRGTLEATWTTPASRLSMLIGASIRQLVISLLFLTITLFMACLLYGFELRGDPLTLLGLLSLSLLPIIGLGMLFASLILWMKETSSLVVIVRGIFMAFAGMTYPIEVLPARMQILSKALPLTHAIRAMRLVGLIGVGWNDVKYEVMMLAILSVVFIAMGLMAFRLAERHGQSTGTLGHY